LLRRYSDGGGGRDLNPWRDLVFWTPRREPARPG